MMPFAVWVSRRFCKLLEYNRFYKLIFHECIGPSDDMRKSGRGFENILGFGCGDTPL